MTRPDKTNASRERAARKKALLIGTSLGRAIWITGLVLVLAGLILRGIGLGLADEYRRFRHLLRKRQLGLPPPDRVTGADAQTPPELSTLNQMEKPNDQIH